MVVAPPGPFPQRVRAAPPRRVPRVANACVHVTARESVVAWLAASHSFPRTSGFAFRLGRRVAAGLRADRDCSHSKLFWFFLNRSFSGRDFVPRCETDAEIHAVRSAGFHPRLGLD